jgi:hypothetical protein
MLTGGIPDNCVDIVAESHSSEFTTRLHVVQYQRSVGVQRQKKSA